MKLVEPKAAFLRRGIAPSSSEAPSKILECLISVTAASWPVDWEFKMAPAGTGTSSENIR